MIYIPGGGGMLGGPPGVGIGCCCKGAGGFAVGGNVGSTSSHSDCKSPELNLQRTTS